MDINVIFDVSRSAYNGTLVDEQQNKSHKNLEIYLLWFIHFV